jgi:SAM-dependent methyltransferase
VRLLDVGCGNNSPTYVKRVRPDIYYIGIDVADYNQTGCSLSLADEYHLCKPVEFASTIRRFEGSVDAVVSSHNLEHCDAREDVLASMAATLASDGRIFLSFPSEASVHFPSRRGCLNFFDDKSHKSPVCWSVVLQALNSAGLQIEYEASRYRPLGPFLRGLVYEPISMLRRKVAPDGSTWALYGFESVIWARRAQGNEGLKPPSA